jgi:hypothetical protein
VLAGCSSSGLPSAHHSQTPAEQVAAVFTRDAGYPPPDSQGGADGWLKAVRDDCAFSDTQLAIEGPLLYSQSATGFAAMKDSMAVICPAQADKLTH